jgi:imidazolonepropionase-like amidohydrolase
VTSYRVAGTVLPDGNQAELWTHRGLLSTAPVADAEDLPGRYVLPGLVDAHAHLTIDMSGTGLASGSDDLVAANLRAQRDSGVLLVRDIGRVRDEPLAVREDDPEVAQAGRFLGPAGGWVAELHVATPPDRVPDAVRAQLASGVRWVKVVGDWKHDGEIRLNYPLELLREVADLVHAGGARLAVHAIEADACRAAVECGADSVEHGCALDESLVAEMGRRGVAWTPTLTAVTSSPERAEPMRAVLPVAVARGVPVLAGTDVAPHGSVAGEVALLVAYGLSPVEALCAATTTARAFLGYPGLAQGAPADLVTYDADPRDDVTVLASPVAVLRRGVRVR